MTLALVETNVLSRFTSDYGEALEEVACSLCGGTESNLLYEAGDVLYGRPGSYRVVRCSSCSLAYVNPRPTFTSLAKHYPDDYHCYQPIEHLPRLLQPLARVAARGQVMRRLRHIEKAVGRLRPEHQIVDVGCGLNDFLRVVKEVRGAVGTGVDMKESVVAHVRDTLRMPIVQGTLQEAKFESGSFDLVTMFEYLEHELNPCGVLAEARRVLKPGGHVAIEIPDIEGWPARTFKNRWANLDLPRHLVFFERQTLERAFAKYGFELVSYTRFGIPMYIGISVLFGLGLKDLSKHRLGLVLLAHLFGMPFLPALPWLPEFVFAVGRAV